MRPHLPICPIKMVIDWLVGLRYRHASMREQKRDDVDANPGEGGL